MDAPSGPESVARCGPALRDITDATRDLADSEAVPRGRLRVTASIDFGSTGWRGKSKVTNAPTQAARAEMAYRIEK